MSLGVLLLLVAPAFAQDAAADPPALNQVWIVSLIGFLAFILGGSAVWALAKGNYFGLRAAKEVSYLPTEYKIFASTRVIVWAVVIFGILGAAATLLFTVGLEFNKPHGFIASLGADLLAGSAAAGLGGLMGFIFGIPRSTVPTSQLAMGESGERQDRAVQAALAANTNLERVSDWLTTLLVGATLVQLTNVPGWIKALADYVGPSEDLTNAKIIPFIVIYYFTLAFLGVYLVTRLYLTTALAQALSQLEGTAEDRHVSDVRMQLENALKTDTIASLKEAREFLKNSSMTEVQLTDAKLNFVLAKVIAAQMRHEPALIDDERERYKKAVDYAARDDKLKAQLVEQLGKDGLITGDPKLDQDLRESLPKS